jgi:hypothetical protein
MQSGAGLGRCVAVGAVVLACGCSSGTSVTNQWVDRTHAMPVMHDYIVMAARVDQTSRRTLEDTLAAALIDHGVHATASYMIWPDALPPADAARDVVEKAKFDGMLVAMSRGVTERVSVVPGGGFWGGYYGYYGGAWGPVWDWSSGYAYTDRFVKFETTLWDPTGGGRLVWSAITQTENPSSGRAFVRSLTDKVIPELVRIGILPQKVPGPSVSSATAHD